MLKKYDTTLAIIGSSFLFSMLHGNLGQIPFTFVLGLVMAYARVKTDSMLPSILIHFGNNFYAVILMSLGELLPENVTLIADIAVITALMLAGFVSFYYLAKKDKDFFRIEQGNSLLTNGERLKAFFSSGAVIASTILLTIEAIAVLEFI